MSQYIIYFKEISLNSLEECVLYSFWVKYSRGIHWVHLISDNVSLFKSCLDDLSVSESGVPKLLNNAVLRLICSILPSNIYFVKLLALEFGI